MAGCSGGFDALEDMWRRRVDTAREQYLAAVSRTRSEAERQQDPSAGDRGDALAQARLAEREALAHYLDVLRVFKDLVLKGKIPPEEGSSQAR
jgi:hypothetical protein